MNSEKANAEAGLIDNEMTIHKRGKSLGSFRMTGNSNMIAKDNQRKLRRIVIQEDKKDKAELKQCLSNFHQSLSPKQKALNGKEREALFLPMKTTKKKTLVLDLDETLVHSSFSPYNHPADIVVKIELDRQKYNIYVLIRPGVREFLKKMSELFELVLFTASISSYANPVMNIIDRDGYCSYRLYREHCTLINTAFVKDMRKLNRNLSEVVILDNSPLSYALNKDNGLPIESWYGDTKDRELEKLIPLLTFLAEVADVREYIPKFVANNEISFIKANYIIRKYHNTPHTDMPSKDKPASLKYFKYLNDLFQNKQLCTSNERKGKKKKFYIGTNSNIKVVKSPMSIKLTPSLSGKTEGGIQCKSESEGDLLKFFFNESNGMKLNTPTSTLRNNIVLNYQAMKSKLKQKKHSKGESCLLSLNKYNLTSVLSNTQNNSNQSKTFNAFNVTNNTRTPTCLHSDSKKSVSEADKPLTMLPLNAIASLHNKSAMSYFKAAVSGLPQAFTNGNHYIDEKKSSFSSSHKSKLSSSLDKRSQLKELRIDSNDFMIPNYKPTKTTRYSISKGN